MISLVLVDDHHVVRQGLRSLLEEEPDFQVIGEASDGLEAVRLVEDLRPNILVLDLMIGGINGLEVARQVLKYSRQTGVVMLSMYNNEAYVLEALRAGARAYVLKESTGAELVKAIREVLDGRHYLSQPLSELAIKAYIEKSRDAVFDPYDTLTKREREVLHMTAHGYTSAEIAARLCISNRTVEFHRSHMMHKLGLRNQSHLIPYAINRGILPSPIYPNGHTR
jgi:two-component system response regulator NreC